MKFYFKILPVLIILIGLSIYSCKVSADWIFDTQPPVTGVGSINSLSGCTPQTSNSANCPYVIIVGGLPTPNNITLPFTCNDGPINTTSGCAIDPTFVSTNLITQIDPSPPASPPTPTKPCSNTDPTDYTLPGGLPTISSPMDTKSVTVFFCSIDNAGNLESTQYFTVNFTPPSAWLRTNDGDVHVNNL